MARLTKNQLQRLKERKAEEQEALQKKLEKQKEKEKLGEFWKEEEYQLIQKELEEKYGEKGIPQIYDSKDLYDYFKPIKFYKDHNNEKLNMDFEKFMEVEKQYSLIIRNQDEILKTLRKEDEENNTEDLQQNNIHLLRLKEDGVAENDGDLPLDDTEAKRLEKASGREIEVTPTQRVKAKLNEALATYFNRFVPLYDKHICTCCGKSQPLSNYYVVYNATCSNRIDNKGSLHMWICKDCAQKLFNYLYWVKAEKDIVKAMQYWCANLNLYWDPEVFEVAKEAFEEGERKGSLVGCYIKTINQSYPGLTFMDSSFIKEGQAKDTTVIPQKVEEAPYHWTKEEAKNKKDIVHIFGYDPFQFEEDDNEKRILYADLASVVDEEIAQDYVKLQSALTIVKSFTKVRKLDEKAHVLEQEQGSLADQKAVADLKAKELKAISDFSRDSGFSERFKTRQSQGQTSFAGIMKTMNEKQFEDELINKYDIQTSSTIQAAADASFRAIFAQLNLSEAEAYKLAAEQLAEIRKIKKEKDDLQEALRKTKYELTELRLRQEAQQRGVDIYES